MLDSGCVLEPVVPCVDLASQQWEYIMYTLIHITQCTRQCFYPDQRFLMVDPSFCGAGINLKLANRLLGWVVRNLPLGLEKPDRWKMCMCLCACILYCSTFRVQYYSIDNTLLTLCLRLFGCVKDC